MTLTHSTATLPTRAPDADGVGADTGLSGGLDTFKYFNRRIEGSGLFHDRFGRKRLGFNMTMHGRWEGDVFCLAEDFRYDDGRVEEREWRIRRQSHGRMVATAEDVIGTAKAETLHDEVRWRYRIGVAIGSRKIVLSFDDRLYLRPSGELLNVSQARKFGILVGRVTAVFRPT